MEPIHLVPVGLVQGHQEGCMSLSSSSSWLKIEVPFVWAGFLEADGPSESHVVSLPGFPTKAELEA